MGVGSLAPAQNAGQDKAGRCEKWGILEVVRFLCSFGLQLGNKLL